MSKHWGLCNTALTALALAREHHDKGRTACLYWADLHNWLRVIAYHHIEAGRSTTGEDDGMGRL